jgi:hypothetical protein
MKKTLLLSLAIMLLGTYAQAQVPQVINYQGRIVVGTTNFNGTGQFKFALVDAAGTTTYWSNDGTSSGGSQPTNAVSLTVTNGLYSVLLGDTTIANMTSAVPGSVFNNSDVRLRVWFNDGTHLSQLLTPDQRIAAVGYAMVAGGVRLPATTSVDNGTITMNGMWFLHAYGPNGLGDRNTFAGWGAGNLFLTGGGNTGAGYQALGENGSGYSNTATGTQALFSNDTGYSNTANGAFALNENLDGHDNTAIGANALESSVGSGNIALGSNAGVNHGSGDNNIYIGNGGVPSESNIIRIGGGQSDTYLAGVIHGNGSGLTLPSSTTFSGNISLPATNMGGTAGVLNLGGSPFLQAFGSANVFVGTNAGNSSLAGAFNAGFGFGALGADTNGTSNTATGYLASGSNTIGNGNTAAGWKALFPNTTGSQNVAIGFGALATQSFSNMGNVWSSNNVAVGYSALSNTNSTNGVDGTNNTALGTFALTGNTTGTSNTAAGFKALQTNTSGNFNVAVGDFALSGNTQGLSNVAIGDSALVSNTSAGNNVAIGASALASQGQAFSPGSAWQSNNVAIGSGALSFNNPTLNTNGINNTALGAGALGTNTTGANNIAIGRNAGQNLTIGNNNIDIGNTGTGGESNTIRIGDGTTQTDTYLTGVMHSSANVAALAVGGSVDPSLLLRLTNSATTGTVSTPNVIGIGFGQSATRQAIVGGTFGNDYLDFFVGGALTAPKVRISNAGNVGIGTSSPNFLLTLSADSAGKPNGGSWANTSDQRVKQNIQPMKNALARLTQLRGVTFEWRNPEDHANQNGPQAGFIAQEVESVFPKWVSEVNATEHDRALSDNGKTKSLSLPFEFDALVVESIKQQQSEIAAKDHEIAALQAEVEDLKARAKENDARLARLEQQMR